MLFSVAEDPNHHGLHNDDTGKCFSSIVRNLAAHPATGVVHQGSDLALTVPLGLFSSSADFILLVLATWYSSFGCQIQTQQCPEEELLSTSGPGLTSALERLPGVKRVSFAVPTNSC